MELKFKHDQIIVVGDIHGMYGQLRFNLTNKRDITDALVICVGDIGMGFHKPNYYKTEFGKLQRAMEPRNINIVFIRGNHDDPAYFTGVHPSIFEYENLHCVPDYTVIVNGEQKILTVGGGLSIDRTYRTAGASYWPDEGVVFTPEWGSYLTYLEGITTIITHMSPANTWPIDKGPLITNNETDKTLIHEDMVMRLDLYDIYDLVRKNNTIKNWYFGHYHEYHVEYMDDVRMQCCDSNVLYEM